MICSSYSKDFSSTLKVFIIYEVLHRVNAIFTCVFIFMLGNRNYLRALGREVADLRLENAELKKIVLGQSITSSSDKKTAPSFNRHDFFPCADKAHFFAMDPKLGSKTELQKNW